MISHLRVTAPRARRSGETLAAVVLAAAVIAPSSGAAAAGHDPAWRAGRLIGVVVNSTGRPWAHQRLELFTRPQDRTCVAFCDPNEQVRGIVTWTDARGRYAIAPRGRVTSLSGYADVSRSGATYQVPLVARGTRLKAVISGHNARVRSGAIGFTLTLQPDPNFSLLWPDATAHVTLTACGGRNLDGSRAIPQRWTLTLSSGDLGTSVDLTDLPMAVYRFTGGFDNGPPLEFENSQGDPWGDACLLFDPTNGSSSLYVRW